MLSLQFATRTDGAGDRLARHRYACLAVMVGTLVSVAVASAQSFPQAGKPVRIVVPFPAGGATDVQARQIGQKITESTGSAVIVENRPGGSTVIAAREVQKAPPDGHTLLYTISIHLQLQHLYRTPPWDVFRDFTPITAGALGGTVLTAHASVPASSLKELIAYAKAQPGRLNFASFGTGTTSHLNGEWMKKLAGIDIVHVPYKGSGDAMKDLLAGEVHLFFDGVTTALSNVRTGRVKLIAAATEKRIPALPELPTMREEGIDIALDGFLGFFGPAGMPPAIVDAVYRELARAIEHPDIRQAFRKDGYEASGMPPSDYAKFLRELSARWANVIRDVGVKIDP